MKRYYQDRNEASISGGCSKVAPSSKGAFIFRGLLLQPTLHLEFIIFIGDIKIKFELA